MRKSNPELVKSVASNPLPASYEITPQRAENVKTLAASIRAEHFKGLDLTDPQDAPGGVQDGKQTSKRILQVATWIWRVFLVAVIILLITSTLLIGNTIRLSIFSRRREIEVMKLVGATNWFVRGPFVVEGLLCGLVGSIAAIVLLLLGRVAWNAVVDIDGTSSDVRALSFSVTALILVAVGLGVGAVGSGLTMRRFLRI
jgi:cell division transport system permease protein